MKARTLLCVGATGCVSTVVANWIWILKSGAHPDLIDFIFSGTMLAVGFVIFDLLHCGDVDIPATEGP